MDKMRLLVLPLLIFLSMTSLSYYLYEVEQHNVQDITNNQLKKVKDKFRKILEQDVFAFKRLSNRISYMKNLNKRFWLKDVTENMQDFDFYEAFLRLDKNGNIQWEESDAQSFHYPPKNIGSSKQDRTFISNYQKSIENKDYVYFVHRLENYNGFYGYSVGVVDLNLLFRQILGEIDQKNFTIIIKESNNILFEEKASEGILKYAQTEDVRDYGLEWEFTMVPTKSFISSLKSNLAIPFLLIGVIISIFSFFLIQAIIRSRNLKNEIEKKYNELSAYSELLKIGNSSSLKTLDDRLYKSLNVITSAAWLHKNKRRGAILIKQGENLHLRASLNLTDVELELYEKVKSGEGFVGNAFALKETTFNKDYESQYNVPIIYDGIVLGIVLVFMPSSHKKNEIETYYLETCARIMSSMVRADKFKLAAVENERLNAVQSMITTYNHEINNPLAIALGSLNRIDKKYPKFADTKNFERLRASINRVHEIVQQINDISKADSLDTEDYSARSKMIKVKKTA